MLSWETTARCSCLPPLLPTVSGFVVFVVVLGILHSESCCPVVVLLRHVVHVVAQATLAAVHQQLVVTRMLAFACLAIDPTFSITATASNVSIVITVIVSFATLLTFPGLSFTFAAGALDNVSGAIAVSLDGSACSVGGSSSGRAGGRGSGRLISFTGLQLRPPKLLLLLLLLLPTLSLTMPDGKVCACRRASAHPSSLANLGFVHRDLWLCSGAACFMALLFPYVWLKQHGCGAPRDGSNFQIASIVAHHHVAPLLARHGLAINKQRHAAGVPHPSLQQEGYCRGTKAAAASRAACMRQLLGKHHATKNRKTRGCDGGGGGGSGGYGGGGGGVRVAVGVWECMRA